MTLRHIPNAISLLRILLAVPLAWMLAMGDYDGALWTFTLAAFSDGLDGWLARRFGWTSRLGSILDPLGDKVLLATSYVVLGWHAVLPLWLVALVIGRDVVILGGAVAYHYLVDRYDMAPTFASKLNTGLQVLLVLAVVAGKALGVVPAQVIDLLTAMVAVSTLVSGFEYVWVWGRRACRARCTSDGVD